VLRIYSDFQALSRAVAEAFAGAMARGPVEGRLSVALAGGSTPRRAYELLAADPLRQEIAWGRVHVFFGDERCVPPADPRSNERMAREALLDRVPIPRGQIHPIHCGPDSRAEARRYEALLLRWFGGAPRFDLALQGLGEDGHTASLKPGSAALGERERLVAAVPDRGEGFDRVTLTAPALNGAREVVFAVSGRSKAPALREILEGEWRPSQFPAQLIHSAGGEPLWLADEAAAALLEQARRDLRT
jgi:6-phosphogluconolactonase